MKRLFFSTYHSETGTQRRVWRGEQRVAARTTCHRFGRVLHHSGCFNATLLHLTTHEQIAADTLLL